MSPLANYTTQVQAETSAHEIEQMLRARSARAILKQYSDKGELSALSFVIPTRYGDLAFTLPANIDAVQKVLTRQAVRARIDRARAQRVGWRILRDWVRAQMAIIETEMVSAEEVFLPYMQVQGQTLFKMFQDKGFKQLGMGGT